MAKIAPLILLVLLLTYLGLPILFKNIMFLIYRLVLLIVTPVISILDRLQVFAALGALLGVIGMLAVTASTAAIVILYLFTIPIRIFARGNSDRVIRYTIENVIGQVNIRELRHDLVSILHTNKDLNDSADLAEIHTIREDAKARYQTGELIFTLITGIILFFHSGLLDFSEIILQIPFFAGESVIQFPLSAGRLISIYVLLLTPAMTFRITITDILAYSSEDETGDIDTQTVLTWQRAITSVGWLQGLALSMAFLKRWNKRGYEQGMEIVREWYNSDASLFEALIEGTTSSRD